MADMSQGSRPERLGDQLRAEISELLAREVHDPGIGFITLTRARVTADLQLARIFYTTLGDANARKNTARALDRATPFLRRQIGRRLRLRHIPELEFRFDESIEQQDRIEQLLRELADERSAQTSTDVKDDDGE